MPGNLVGWMGRCNGNKTDPVTGVKYNYCDEETQTAKGFQCTDATCEHLLSPDQAENYGTAPGQFHGAIHLTIDPNDIVYVVDHDNDRVQRFLTDGTFAGQAKSTGAGITDDGGFVLGNMGKPRHVSVNSKEFHVLERSDVEGDYFLHIFKTLPFYDITPSSVKVDYVSQFNFQGQDRFTYLVDDGIAQSAPASVTIDVARAYRAPDNLRVECFTDALFSVARACDVNEDTALYLRLRADDLDGFIGFGGLDTLTYSIVTAPTHGQLVLLNTQTDHADYRYEPVANYFGEDSFTFQADDGNASAAQPGALTFNVIPVRDAAVITYPAEIRVARGFAEAFRFEFNDVDRDSFPQPAAISIYWGDGVGVSPDSTPAWVNIGIVDQNGNPLNPHINTQPGSGYLVGAHVYNASTTGIQIRMMAQGDPSAGCSQSPPVQVIEATHVSISGLTDETDSVAPVEPATDFVFRAFISNDTPQGWPGLTANNTQVTFTFPAGVNVISRDARCASGNPVTCSLGNMTVGARTPVEFVLNIDPAAAADNYTFGVLAELVDDGPRISNKTVASLTVQLADDDQDGTINFYDAFPKDPRGANDADHDGMADEWELAYGLKSNDPADALLDSDGDGLTNLQEFINGTYPFLAEVLPQSTTQRIEQGGDDLLGIHLAAGDINGDGYSDVVGGAPAYNSNQGAIVIYYGGSNGVTASAPVTQTGTTGFGRIVEVGNINNDSYADIVVKSNQDAYLYLGGVGGLSAPIQIPTQNPLATTFANAIVIADIDNDQVPDLLMASPADDIGGITDNGAVYVYRGSSQYWLQASPLPDMTISANLDGLKLGDSLVVTDINGDTVPDLLVGTAFYGAGHVYGYLGNNINWTITNHLTPDFTLDGEAISDRFAYAMATGADFDGDGISDLVVGAYANSGYGAVYLYRSTEQYWSTATTPQKIQGNASGDQLGTTVALMPSMTYTGEPVVVAGSNRAERDAANPDEGRVDLYTLSDLTAPFFTDYGDPHDMLGYHVINAGDVNGDGEIDIAMGAPDITISGHTGDGGYVRIYFAGKTAQQLDDDADFVANQFDNCKAAANTDQADADGDGVGDVCDSTPQGDGGRGNTGSGGGGGGCSYNPAARFDPLFALMLLLSCVYLWRRRNS